MSLFVSPLITQNITELQINSVNPPWMQISFSATPVMFQATGKKYVTRNL
jgi:hypothetical protein